MNLVSNDNFWCNQPCQHFHFLLAMKWKVEKPASIIDESRRSKLVLFPLFEYQKRVGRVEAISECY